MWYLGITHPSFNPSQLQPIPASTHPGFNPSRLQPIPARHMHTESSSAPGDIGTTRARDRGLRIPAQPGSIETDRALPGAPQAPGSVPGAERGCGDIERHRQARDAGTRSTGAPSPIRDGPVQRVGGRGTGSAGPGYPRPVRRLLPSTGFPHPVSPHGPSPVPSQPYVCHRSGWRWCPGRCSAAPAAPSSPASSRPTGRPGPPHRPGCLRRPRPLRSTAG